MIPRHIFICLIAFVVLMAFLLFAIGRRERLIADAREDVLTTILKHGGMVQLQTESERAFERLSELDGTTLTRIRIGADEAPEFPILSRLGHTVQVFPARDETPRYVMIIRGGHYSTHILSIFDPNIDESQLTAWDEGVLIHITNGVYLSR